MAAIVARTLPPEENYRAIEAGGPLQEVGIPPEQLARMSVAVVEVDGVIVAYWVVWYALHVEPLWIREDHRKSVAVVKGLVDAMHGIVEASGEAAAFCVIDPENWATVGDYAERFGFYEAPGRLYYLVVQPPAEPVKG